MLVVAFVFKTTCYKGALICKCQSLKSLPSSSIVANFFCDVLRLQFHREMSFYVGDHACVLIVMASKPHLQQNCCTQAAKVD